ncbi:MAG: hypothetical protein RLY86_3363 [Pseudomonadota bacterium]
MILTLPAPFKVLRRVLPALLVLPVLAGCGGRQADAPVVCVPRSTAGVALGAATRDLPACDRAVDDWLAAADGDGDGTLSAGEVAADAAAAFTRLDRDGNGVIVPTEADAALPPRPARTPRGSGPQGRGDPAAAPADPAAVPDRGPPQGQGQRRRAGPPLLLARESTVMAADADTDFRVSPAELSTEAARVAAAADTDGDGRLSPAEARAALAPRIQPGRMPRG